MIKSTENDECVVLLADHGGHGFTYELLVDLSTSVGRCAYAYSAGNVAPHGKLSATPSVRVFPVGRGRFEKYRLWGRLWSELRLGAEYAVTMIRVRPLMVVATNMPVISVLILWVTAIFLRRSRILWLQDVQSGLLSRGERPSTAARILGLLEAATVLMSSRTVAISEEIAGEIGRLTHGHKTVSVLRNWAPLASLPRLDRLNEWSAEHGLDGVTTLVYAGTLARKHNPEMLVQLADSLRGRNALVVVITEGEGGRQLSQVRATDRTLPLLVLPYQPFEQLPQMLASADILLVLLQPGAAQFSVPSKVLSYLCAGRPIVAALPSTNLAASIIESESGGGIVVEPDDVRGFVDAAHLLIGAREVRSSMGEAGRAYAEREFRASVTTARFAEAIGLLVGTQTPGSGQ